MPNVAIVIIYLITYILLYIILHQLMYIIGQKKMASIKIYEEHRRVNSNIGIWADCYT